MIWIGVESESHFPKGLPLLREACKEDSDVNHFFLFSFEQREPQALR